MSNKKKVSIEVLNEDDILKEKGTLKDAPEPIFCSHYLLYDPDEVDLTKCNNLATTKMECCGNDVCDKCKTDFALKCAVEGCDYYKEYNDDGSDESFCKIRSCYLDIDAVYCRECNVALCTKHAYPDEGDTDYRKIFCKCGELYEDDNSSDEESKSDEESSDAESTSSTVMCGIAGCLNYMDCYTPCCHEPVCEDHNDFSYCSVPECENSDDYSYMCAPCYRINEGVICDKCGDRFCADHNTEDSNYVHEITLFLKEREIRDIIYCNSCAVDLKKEIAKIPYENKCVICEKVFTKDEKFHFCSNDECDYHDGICITCYVKDGHEMFGHKCEDERWWCKYHRKGCGVCH